MKRSILIPGLLIVAVLSATGPGAHADVGSSMEAFWDGVGASNFTGPTAFEGQSAGYYTGGNIFMRTRTVNTNLASVNLPSWRAGCGGIDMFAGSFSFINSDQLVALMRSIGTNAVGYAFKLALETISPMIAEQIGNLQDMVQRVNDASINSCETAKGIVGGLWPETDTASKMICEDLGNAEGIFTDRAAARHGCGAGGRRKATLDQAPASIREQIPHDTNIAWQAIRKNPLFADDDSLAELALNLSGTVVVKAPNGDSDEPVFVYHAQKGGDADLIKTLLSGGTLTLNVCLDKDKCLDIDTAGTLDIPAKASFAGRVERLLVDIQDKIGTDGALTREELALLNATEIPIYKLINVLTAYRGGIAGLELPQYADLIALDILYRYLTNLLGEIEKSSGALTLASTTMVRDWKREISEARRALRDRSREVSERFNKLITLVDSVRTLENQLLGGLSGGIRGNLAFLKGGFE